MTLFLILDTKNHVTKLTNEYDVKSTSVDNSHWLLLDEYLNIDTLMLMMCDVKCCRIFESV